MINAATAIVPTATGLASKGITPAGGDLFALSMLAVGTSGADDIAPAIPRIAGSDPAAVAPSNRQAFAVSGAISGMVMPAGDDMLDPALAWLPAVDIAIPAPLDIPPALASVAQVPTPTPTPTPVMSQLALRSGTASVAVATAALQPKGPTVQGSTQAGSGQVAPDGAIDPVVAAQADPDMASGISIPGTQPPPGGASIVPANVAGVGEAASLAAPVRGAVAVAPDVLPAAPYAATTHSAPEGPLAAPVKPPEMVVDNLPPAMPTTVVVQDVPTVVANGTDPARIAASPLASAPDGRTGTPIPLPEATATPHLDRDAQVVDQGLPSSKLPADLKRNPAPGSPIAADAPSVATVDVFDPQIVAGAEAGPGEADAPVERDRRNAGKAPSGHAGVVLAVPIPSERAGNVEPAVDVAATERPDDDVKHAGEEPAPAPFDAVAAMINPMPHTDVALVAQHAVPSEPPRPIQNEIAAAPAAAAALPAIAPITVLSPSATTALSSSATTAASLAATGDVGSAQPQPQIQPQAIPAAAVEVNRGAMPARTAADSVPADPAAYTQVDTVVSQRGDEGTAQPVVRQPAQPLTEAASMPVAAAMPPIAADVIASAGKSDLRPRAEAAPVRADPVQIAPAQLAPVQAVTTASPPRGPLAPVESASSVNAPAIPLTAAPANPGVPTPILAAVAPVSVDGAHVSGEPAQVAAVTTPSADLRPTFMREVTGNARQTVALRPQAAVQPQPAAGTTAPAAQVFGAAMHAVVGRDERKPAEPLDTTIAAAAAPTPVREVAAIADSAQPTLDMRQGGWPMHMVDHIEALRDAANATDTRIRLVPDALGVIDISVKTVGDALHVRFAAEDPATRALIEDAQPRLADIAQERGLRIGQSVVEPGVGQPGAGQSGTGQSGAGQSAGGQSPGGQTNQQSAGQSAAGNGQQQASTQAQAGQQQPRQQPQQQAANARQPATPARSPSTESDAAANGRIA